MSMTQEESKLHQKYEDLSEGERIHIDEAYHAARKVLAGICTPANDDRAEQLVAAITRYYLESL